MTALSLSPIKNIATDLDRHMMKSFLSLSSPKQTYMTIYAVNNNSNVNTCLYVQYMLTITRTKHSSCIHIKILILLYTTITSDCILTHAYILDDKMATKKPICTRPSSLGFDDTKRT